MPNPLTTSEVALFHMLVRPAIILLLLMRLARPANIQEIASLLGLHEQTTSRYLRQLAATNLVVRRDGCYELGREINSLFGGAFLPSDPTRFASTTTIDIDLINKSESKAVVVDPDSDANNTFPPPSSDPPPRADPELEQALLEAGIGEPKRSALAIRPGLTPHAVRAWEMLLKREKGEHYKPGLLIFVLENDEPPPRTQKNGHLLDCDCDDCHWRKNVYCPNCYPDRCHCGWIDVEYGSESEEEEDDEEWEEDKANGLVEKSTEVVDYW